jgi:hypothetical protein
MLIVMAAVVVAVMISATFVARESTASVVTDNIQSHTQARLIAESALELAIQHVRAGGAWRSEHPSGLWVSAQPYLGGAYTLYGDDGEPVHGQFIGDGDLTDSPVDPLTLTAVASYRGTTHTAHATLRFSPGGGVFAEGLIAGEYFVMKNSAQVDSWNSSLGDYSTSNSGDQAVVITNATDSQKVSLLNNIRVNGDIVIGPGGDPDRVVEQKNSASYTGEIIIADEAAAIETPTAPTDVGPSAGTREFTSNSDSTIASDLHLSNLYLKNSAIVRISGHVRIVVDGTVELDNNSRILMEPGASLELYVRDRISVKNSAEANTNTADPSALKLFMTGSNPTVELVNNMRLYAQVYGGRSTMYMKNSAEFYGTFQGKHVELLNNARFHQDLADHGGAAGSGGSGGSGGGGAGSGANSSVVWYEAD